MCFDQPDPGGSPRATADTLLSLGIELREGAPSCNGQALNRQIEAALAEGHDFFYRVDADDLVFADRFVRQAGLFDDPTTDICGGGLVYRDVDSGRERVMVPKGQPRPADFLVNLAVLHPTMAFRLSRIAESGLRYWSGRVEDKALLLQALRLGLRIRNDGAVYGIYNCSRGARNTAEAARINAVAQPRPDPTDRGMVPAADRGADRTCQPPAANLPAARSSKCGAGAPGQSILRWW